MSPENVGESLPFLGCLMAGWATMETVATPVMWRGRVGQTCRSDRFELAEVKHRLDPMPGTKIALSARWPSLRLLVAID
jgi:hypothetical protein